ncbi:MAG TPA: metal ABC transporter ATP-binding protein [Bacillota bacterium]|jgi:ABC-type Mn2+/Zn2+ transport system ATPase subunit|nr:metal ABC transporter ATP-binding protein [Bacillota bacterium]HOL10773.1 metal ABC transporter ATP-binding protein [Bacillota bacterium]HPO98484.1 metal ABC transporter ATP-binding protein [Bacillota bacterium]
MIGDKEVANGPINKQPILTLTGVTIGYPGITALSKIDCEINKGEYIAVIGPNGSGKSTLLKGILGLLPLQSGKITLHLCNEDHPNIKPASLFGYVPQKNRSETTFPVSVKEVVMMGLYAQIGWFRRPQPQHWELVRQSLAKVGMVDCAERHFSELSGGQQQRVIIARALVSNPQIIILDEPTSAIDISAQQEILSILERLNQEEGKTILMVTHDINEIVHFCNKVLLLGGEKKYFFGPPNEILTRETLVSVYGNRIYVYNHNGHPHVLVGDFNL